VRRGEVIDFLVEPGATDNSDTFLWAPTLVFTGDAATSRTWNAKKDFESPPKPVLALTRWEELAQVLLLSNELAFVD
jgi:hypothetical protein